MIFLYIYIYKGERERKNSRFHILVGRCMAVDREFVYILCMCT